MKLSELKYDGQDRYEDDNIRIHMYYIYFTTDFLNKFKQNLKKLNTSYYLIYDYNYDIKYETELTVYISHIRKLQLIKIVVSEYITYLRKQKLNEIIGT